MFTLNKRETYFDKTMEHYTISEWSEIKPLKTRQYLDEYLCVDNQVFRNELFIFWIYGGFIASVAAEIIPIKICTLSH